MTGKRIGLVIGNNYENSEKELQFAVADALDIKGVLEHKDICGFDDVVLLPNKTSKEASIELERLLKNAGQGDLIFIYFSGHGKKDFTNGLYLLFEDTDEETPLATSLTFDFINQCRKYPQAKQASVVVVLDCCYSGSAELRDTDVEVDIASYSGSGTVILTSTGSKGSPTAKEDKALGHGIFTHYLVEGLKKGHADRTGEGYIYVDDLYQYAYKMTTNRCTQSPKKAGNIEGSIFIGRNPQKIRENEYNSKKSKLLSEYVKKLHHLILNESQTVLRKAYDVPPSLDSVEETIYDLLNSLLKGELQPENYSDAVQHLKGISVSSESSRNNKVDTSKPFTQITNVQRSSFQQVEYRSDAWSNQKYFLIQMFGEKCIPLKSDSKSKLAILVIESPSEDEKYALRTGEILDLGQGYGFEVKQIDIAGEKVWLEFTKDGKRVNDGIVSVVDGSGGTWNVELDDIQGVNNVVVFKVHINQIFQGAVDRIVEIDGLWLIDFKNAFTIKSGDEFNGSEIMEINDEYISYKSLN